MPLPTRTDSARTGPSFLPARRRAARVAGLIEPADGLQLRVGSGPVPADSDGRATAFRYDRAPVCLTAGPGGPYGRRSASLRRAGAHTARACLGQSPVPPRWPLQAIGEQGLANADLSAAPGQ